MGKKLLLLFLILASFLPLSGEKKRGLWTDPDSIDPLKIGVSSFLSVDLGEYFDKAYKAMGKKEYYQANRQEIVAKVSARSKAQYARFADSGAFSCYVDVSSFELPDNNCSSSLRR